jgi:ribose 5-phosphate isomerase A
MASSRAAGRHQPSPLGDRDTIEREKRSAAEAAAGLVEDGMRLGLGTGSTVAYLLDALGERELRGLDCAATSPETERRARALGLKLHPLDELGELDLAIDGTDQVDPEGWLVKGGGGAHTREKIVASAARRFVVIASANKAVPALTPPVPLELMRFAVGHTLRALAPAELRPKRTAARDPSPDSGRAATGSGRAAQDSGRAATDSGRAATDSGRAAQDSGRAARGRWWQSPDGGLIADYLGPIDDPGELSTWLSAVPGVIEHGLFPPEMVSLILIAGEQGVEHRAGKKRDR